MAKDLRESLDRVLSAFEVHLDVVETSEHEDDPAVLQAAAALADAFEAYDELLYDEYGVDTPFVVYDGDDEELDDDELDDDIDEDDSYDEDLEIDDDLQA